MQLTLAIYNANKISLPVIGLSSLLISGCSEKISERNPNIVYILADDLGYGDLSCLNPESKISTPNIDKLAKEGITFTDAHSGSAVSTPTRYGILTGRYCWRSELKSSVLWDWDEPLIEPERLTVGDFLKQNGYTTACIGKWHLGWEWTTTDGSRMNAELKLGEYIGNIREAFGYKVDFAAPIKEGPVERGFDYYFGDDVPNFPPYCFMENDKTVGIPGDKKPAGMHGSNGPMIEGWKLEDVMPALTEKAVDYIKNKKEIFKRRKGSPFFLYFSLTAPHNPIAPAEGFKGKSQAGAYGDYVQQIDHTVGQILKALEEEGVADNTLVIFTSDNGSPGMDGTNMAGPLQSVHRFGHYPSYHFRGMKADIYEGGHHIPFIARWPGKIVQDTKCDETICLTDLLATCAAITGKELPDDSGEDSYNILPLMKGIKQDKPVRDATVHHSAQGAFAIRQGEWKLIIGGGSGGWSAPRNDEEAAKSGLPLIQLYNLSTDIGEENNQYDKYPEVVAQMSSILGKYKREGRSVPFKVPFPLQPGSVL